MGNEASEVEATENEEKNYEGNQEKVDSILSNTHEQFTDDAHQREGNKRNNENDNGGNFDLMIFY